MALEYIADAALSGVAFDIVPVTLGTTVLADVAGLRIGEAGDIVVRTKKGNTRFIEGLGAGEYFPVAVDQVLATATVDGASRTTSARKIMALVIA